MEISNVRSVLLMILGFLSLPIMAMEQNPSGQQEPIIYVKNSSEYLVRISAGPDYPNSIALYPGQIVEFPLKKVPSLTASTYGKVSHYLAGIIAELNVTKLLEDSPEYATKDCFVNITYEKNSSNQSFWSFARCFFTQGKWALSLAPADHDKDLIGYQDTPCCSTALYNIIAQNSDPSAEAVARDAALIWTMFPRAASKIENHQTVYPFNILGIDIGGLIVSDQQLRNWGALLSSSLRKKFSAVTNPAVWSAVNMIIADSVEALRHGKYYNDCDPHYPITLLYIPTTDSAEQAPTTGPAFPAEIIAQLKERFGEDAAAQSLLGRLEKAARTQSWTEQAQQLPPPPPPPPCSTITNGKSYQERGILKFLAELEQKKPEEQILLDKVAKELFERIDKIGLDHEETIKLKYAALDRLRVINQSKQAMPSLCKIREFLSPKMILLAHKEQNPPAAMQEWISLLDRVDREKAHEYFRMEEKPLQKEFHEQLTHRDYQELLMTHLRQQIRRFQSTDD